MYFFNPQILTGRDAQIFAEKYGANLISIQDATENVCIVDDLNKNGFGGTIWIGLGDANKEGFFEWYDQKPLGYINWDSGEPNDFGTGEDCVQIFTNGKWNDFPCWVGDSRSIIEVNLCPQTKISASLNNFCPGDSTKLSTNTKLGAFPYSYTWFSKPTGFTSNSANPVVKPVVTTTYYVTSVDRYGCMSGDSIQINVKPPTNMPVITSNKPPVICAGDSVILTASSGAGYLWSTGQVTPFITVLAAGNYAVTITDANGCKAASAPTIISINNPPFASFTTVKACSQSETKFTDQSLTGTGSIIFWSWDFGDGKTDTVKNPSHVYAAAGNYVVMLLVKNSAGCMDTAKTSIHIDAVPDIDFKDTTVCKGNPTLFTGISSAATGKVKTWNWEFGDGKTDTVKNPSHVYAVAGNYIVTLNITNVHGCKNKLTKNIMVNELPIAAFTKNSVCEGASVSFKDASTMPGGTIQSWLWNFGDGSPVSNNQNPSHTYPLPNNTFTVSLLVTSNLGCLDSVVKTIKINPKPIVNFTTVDTVGCKKLCVNFKDQSSIASGNNQKWIWTFGDASVKSDLKNPIHCYENTSKLLSALFNITLTVTSDSGCVASHTKNDFIKLNPRPQAAFTADPSIAYLINPVISFNNLSVGANMWSWYFGDSVTSTLQNPLPHTYSDTGSYVVSLIASTQYNCADTTYLTVIIKPDFYFYIPNSFTPNDDGINDTFCGKGIFNSNFKMLIYNKWGELVFSTDDITESWDGTIKGGTEMALEDVYVYHISLKDIHRKLHVYRGIINLIR